MFEVNRGCTRTEEVALGDDDQVTIIYIYIQFPKIFCIWLQQATPGSIVLLAMFCFMSICLVPLCNDYLMGSREIEAVKFSAASIAVPKQFKKYGI